MPKRPKPISKANTGRAKQQQALKDALAVSKKARAIANKSAADRRRK